MGFNHTLCRASCTCFHSACWCKGIWRKKMDKPWIFHFATKRNCKVWVCLVCLGKFVASKQESEKFSRNFANNFGWLTDVSSHYHGTKHVNHHLCWHYNDKHAFRWWCKFETLFAYACSACPACSGFDYHRAISSSPSCCVFGSFCFGKQ